VVTLSGETQRSGCFFFLSSSVGYGWTWLCWLGLNDA